MQDSGPRPQRGLGSRHCLQPDSDHIAQAAENQHVKPRTISFKGTMQTLNALQPVIALQESWDSRVLMNFIRSAA